MIPKTLHFDEQPKLQKLSNSGPIWTHWRHIGLKYISHEVQNKFLSIMALRVLREIASSLQLAVFYTVMVDETTDMSNQEQVVLVF